MPATTDSDHDLVYSSSPTYDGTAEFADMNDIEFNDKSEAHEKVASELSRLQWDSFSRTLMQEMERLFDGPITIDGSDLGWRNRSGEAGPHKHTHVLDILPTNTQYTLYVDIHEDDEYIRVLRTDHDSPGKQAANKFIIREADN